ncbi:MAG TPA: hypothetical protein VGD76_20945 [Ramlibacter sp.]
MQYTQDPSLVLDALSTRVLGALSPSAWRKLFLRPHHEVMQFAPARGTFLCAAVQVPAWSAGASMLSELSFLAATHGGELDPCPPATALVRFDDAQAALEMAREMQNMMCDVRFQVGLVSGDCTLASLQLEGRVLRLLAGDAVDRAEAVTRLAAPGTIRIAPETFALLHEDIVGMSHWMVTTEYEGDSMTAASLTLPPRANAHLSTFAGLGLT